MSYERSAQYYDYFDTKPNTSFYVELEKQTTGDVLELGVGTGRVLFEICKTGRDGVGIDKSVEMLKEAKRKRRYECPEISGRCRLLAADMLTFDLGREFGFIYSPSSGVQTDSPDHLRGIFRCVSDHLAEDGVFAFDCSSPAVMKRTLSHSPERAELPGGRVVIRFVAQTYNEGDEVTSFDLLFKEHIPGRTTAVTVHESGVGAIVTRADIEDALDYAGLKVREMYGGFDRSPYTDESKWIVVVAGR